MKGKKLKVREKGITLIALVITIIVLLILGGVSIAMLTGDNGIITQANNAKEETENAQEDELRRLTTLEAATNLENTTHTDNSTGEEKTVTIPAGFAVSQVEGEKTIADGLVIIDKNGNEYVWIPVDGILGKDGTIEDVQSKRKILLGRYDFENGTPIIFDGEYKEEDLRYGSKPAKDIEKFIESVRINKGYYIGRFEAGIAGYDPNNIIKDNADREEIWSGYNPKDGEKLELVSKKGKQVWNYITQSKASNLCQNLYDGMESDLINSYARDTATLFIQANGTNSNYSSEIGQSINTNFPWLTGIGVLNSTNKVDVECNIYDLAGNCMEWSTEMYNNSEYPCVKRGGCYNKDVITMRARVSEFIYGAYENVSFRPILYF